MDEQVVSDLVREVASGNSDAFERFVLQFRPVLSRTLERRYVRGADVEDILQDAFFRAWSALRAGQYRHIGVAALVGWLKTIASRLALERLREATGSEWLEDDGGERVAKIPSNDVPHDQQLIARDLFAIIERSLDDALGGISPSDCEQKLALLKKTAFLSFYVDRLSQKDVVNLITLLAARVGLEDQITSAAINNWLSRGDILKTLVRFIVRQHPDLIRRAVIGHLDAVDLTEVEREILEGYWAKGLTIASVAKQRHLSEARVQAVILETTPRVADCMFAHIKRQLHDGRRKTA